MENDPGAGPLDKDERTELHRLRDEVATAAGVPTEPVARPPRNGLRWTAVTILLVLVAILIGAFLIGGSSSAKTVRRGYGQALDFVRRSGSGRPPNEVERWANQLRVPLRCAILGVAALLLMFWRYPTGLVVLWIVFIALLALAALELLIRRPAQPPRRTPGRRRARDLRRCLRSDRLELGVGDRPVGSRRYRDRIGLDKNLKGGGANRRAEIVGGCLLYSRRYSGRSTAASPN